MFNPIKRVNAAIDALFSPTCNAVIVCKSESVHKLYHLFKLQSLDRKWKVAGMYSMVTSPYDTSNIGIIPVRSKGESAYLQLYHDVEACTEQGVSVRYL